MLRAALFSLFVAAALANSASPAVPNLPQAFSADVTITNSLMSFPVKGKMYYDYANQIQRVDSSAMGVTQTNLQRFGSSDQFVYAEYFGQKQCKHCWLQPPLLPYVLPPAPLSLYKGQETVNGKACSVWEISAVSGFGMDFDIYVDQSNTLTRAVVDVNAIPGMSYKITMDFANVVAGPQAASLFVPAAYCPADASCQAAMNLVVVLDGSGSISAPDFSKALTFINSLATNFDVDPNFVNVGIVQFSDYANIEIGLSGNSKSILSSVSRISQMGSGTNLPAGLTTAASMLSSATRSAKNQVVLVITDGASNIGGPPSVAADALKKAGVAVFAIGVGQAIDVTQLSSIVSTPLKTHLFTTNGFSALKEVLGNVTATTCQETTCELSQGSSSSFTAFPFHTQADADAFLASNNGDIVSDSNGSNSAVSLTVTGVAVGLLVVVGVAIVVVQRYRRRNYASFADHEMSRI